MTFKFKESRDLLSNFRFHDLFVEELGWNQPIGDRPEPVEIDDTLYSRQCIAEMSEVRVFEISAPDGDIPSGEIQGKIYKTIAEKFTENLLIFINGDRTRCFWYWAKREGSKFYPRDDSIIKGQPVDLLLGKICGLYIDPEELDEEGHISTFEVADRLQRSLDVEKVTKKFYREFQIEHHEFLDYIEGIDNESDRRWYTSVMLNRLMFVYFLQKQGFINSDGEYLRNKLTESQQRGPDRFYNEFLEALFFEGLAKPERDRSPEVQQLLGNVCYLNGGLFLKHPIEGNDRYNISIPDAAFDRVLTLFERYSWHLDDRTGAKADEINPDVLGYIFEKYINQKAFGAYYTRPEITEYLCDRTIKKLIFDRVMAAIAQEPREVDDRPQYENINDMALRMDDEVCRHLLLGDDAILRNLSLLDPACGSGAFLIAAMKTLIWFYEKAIGVVQLSKDRQLRAWYNEIFQEHRSFSYFIKKRIITDNLYGVDIMEEAVEIAKLRLFLALVSSVTEVEELEPLPNIDFNIMAGNSLIGLIRVNPESFDAMGDSEFQQGNLLQMVAANSYRDILEEKNRSIELYKVHAFKKEDEGDTEQDIRLLNLRQHIDRVNSESQAKLNQILLDEFTQRLGIKFEQAQLKGKAKKRDLELSDIEALKPFHWGYHFDRAIEERGGFDAIITNPPWEVFKPNAKEFFAEYSDLVTKNKMDIKEFQKTQKKLLKNPEVAEAWLDYQSRYPYVSNYYRSASQYENQISVVNGRKVGTDINLYKLFVEQCFNLLKPYGDCGIIVPSGVYTDLGAKQLREMLFVENQITSLFGFSNEKFIFDTVHHAFKFTILTFEKSGETKSFPAAFRINPREAIRSDELTNFFNADDEHIEIEVPLIRKLSPDSLSVMEFKNEIDIRIAKKMGQFPLLGEEMSDRWNLKLTSEFHMTNNSNLFEQKPAKGRLPLYEGKMIHQFTHQFAKPRYWVDESLGRTRILKKNQEDKGQVLGYQDYRLAFRDVAASTNERTMIAAVLPPRVFTGNTAIVSIFFSDYSGLLFLVAVLNSFICDFMIRQKVTNHCNMFYVYQLPVPRLVEGDRFFSEIVERAAKLICTTPEFDDLAAEVGLGSHANGVTNERDSPTETLRERAQIRAELDAIVAHLYGLTEAEFAHILSTFPIVPDETKQAALAEYQNFAPLAGDPEIIDLINQEESTQLEFKSTARWNLKENKKDKTMEEVICKTVAAFLNSEGGTLLIGVADDGSIVGLQPDYQTLKKKNRDGYQLWLMEMLTQQFGEAIAPFISVKFGIADGKEVCNVTVRPYPEPTYMTVKDPKSGNAIECFFIRAGNSTRKLTQPSEIQKYIRHRWRSFQ